METVSIHEAKTHLSRLVERAVKGDAFVIAKAGKPLVKVVALDTPAPSAVRRLGFMAEEISVPDDFDRMGSAEIERLSAQAHALPESRDILTSTLKGVTSLP